MVQPGPPQLNDDVKRRILESRPLLQNALAWIKQVEDCGMDCQDYRRQAEQLLTLTDGLIRNFVNPKRRG